jgi:hypothetical protein
LGFFVVGSEIKQIFGCLILIHRQGELGISFGILMPGLSPSEPVRGSGPTYVDFGVVRQRPKHFIQRLVHLLRRALEESPTAKSDSARIQDTVRKEAYLHETRYRR